MNDACLAVVRQTHAAFMDALIPRSVVATAMGLVVIAVALAVVAAPLVLHRYARHVRRLMQLHLTTPPPPAWLARQEPDSGNGGHAIDRPDALKPASPAELKHAAGARLSGITRATWCAYGVFVAGSLPLLQIGPALTGPDLAGYFLGVSVLAAVPALVNIRPQGSKTFALVISVAVGLVMIAFDPTATDWTAAVSVPLAFAALYFLTAHRRLRTVVVPMTVWFIALLVGALVAVWLMLPLSCMPAERRAADWALASTDVTLGLLVFVGFIYAGNRALAGLARLEERGLVSDISMASGVGVALTALLWAFGLGVQGPLPDWLILLCAFGWIGSTVAIYAWIRARSARPGAQRSLVVLRVFSSHRRTHRLLDELQTRWRYVGPVYEIGGPDLVRMNVNPYELAKFVTSRLHELFVFDAPDPQRSPDRLAQRADREGRFRVNEVFCLDSAWHATVEQLIRAGDAIVLDVRGFRRERHGTAFEIGVLARTGRLARVLILGDATTDWDLFDALVRNAGGEPAAATRVQVTTRESGPRLIDRLMQVAVQPAATSGAATA